MAVDVQAIREVFRQQFGGQPSRAGVVGAPPVSPVQPLTPNMQNRQPPQPSQAEVTPSSGTISALGQQKGEAQDITKALIKRLERLGGNDAGAGGMV